MNDVTRQRLRDLIATYSVDVCDEPKRLEALLKDFCAEHRRDVSLLVNALKERVPADLAASSQGAPYAVQRHRLVQRLIDNLGIAASFACWAVDSWALALGRVSDTDLREWDAQPHVQIERPSPRANLTSQLSPLEELRRAIREAFADDIVSIDEQKALKEMSRRLNIPSAVADHVLKEVVDERKGRRR